MNVPVTATLPNHIAIVMDGNGRWAKQRNLPRIAGHKASVETVKNVVKACLEKNIRVLTLFAFSSENWSRPRSEVNFLMNLFTTSLKFETEKLHQQNIQLKIIGDRTRFNKTLQHVIAEAEKLTLQNTGLTLVIAVSYGGRWDICSAVNLLVSAMQKGSLPFGEITPELINTKLSLAGLPDPDLFIRTSGEQRISNFFLWQTAYTELFFSPVYWPDFDATEFERALHFYASRERRFGGIPKQSTRDSLC